MAVILWRSHYDNETSLVLIIFTLSDCNNDQHSANVPTDSSKLVDNAVIKPEKENFENAKIVCDAVYKNEGYKLTLTAFDTTDLSSLEWHDLKHTDKVCSFLAKKQRLSSDWNSNSQQYKCGTFVCSLSKL